ncbi:MAG: TraR/DksA family transcriptional regulator [Pseudomonadota bacterium]|nr:TraR/DksA family transcriptional regulator [Pseudomonadota bacterium]
MPDEIDRAQDLEQAQRDDALAVRFRRAHGEASREELEHMDWRVISALVCVDCDSPIPDARRQAVPGCARCTECQSYYERGVK